MWIIPPVTKLQSSTGTQTAEAAMCAKFGMINHSYLKVIPVTRGTVTNRQLRGKIYRSTAASSCTGFYFIFLYHQQKTTESCKVAVPAEYFFDSDHVSFC